VVEIMNNEENKLETIIDDSASLIKTNSKMLNDLENKDEENFQELI
jgi:hypothetical protein